MHKYLDSFKVKSTIKIQILALEVHLKVESTMCNKLVNNKPEICYTVAVTSNCTYTNLNLYY
jgi:hypothetical protein